VSNFWGSDHKIVKSIKMLTENQIKEFQQICKKQFNKEISKEEALRQGTKLITLMKILVEQYIKDKSKSSISGG